MQVWILLRTYYNYANKCLSNKYIIFSTKSNFDWQVHSFALTLALFAVIGIQTELMRHRFSSIFTITENVFSASSSVLYFCLRLNPAKSINSGIFTTGNKRGYIAIAIEAMLHYSKLWEILKLSRKTQNEGFSFEHSYILLEIISTVT